MLGGRQRRGSSAPTSDMPGTTPSRCGRTWLRWGWPWTPTRRCPSARERVFWSHTLCSLQVKGMEVDTEARPKELVRKPYVLNELEAEASLPEKKGNTLSRDLIDYVRYMVESHGEDYKRSGRASSILCQRIKWKLSDWGTPAPGPVKQELGLKARRGMVYGFRCGCHSPRNPKVAHGPPLEGAVLRGSHLYSGGSRESQRSCFQSVWIEYNLYIIIKQGSLTFLIVLCSPGATLPRQGFHRGASRCHAHISSQARPPLLQCALCSCPALRFHQPFYKACLEPGRLPGDCELRRVTCSVLRELDQI
ncbi:nucleolar protein 16 isoform X3 [Oryctolagus cuniculus]|uniref:nucleolar protein 16 isoform X3 n=1 Tax=Oryctolagus cuniculus TaxID=9986 RepID=UPI002231456C|nr:nucleolar protein 16 isoform X3 [Oryctolagus cuniculus]